MVVRELAPEPTEHAVDRLLARMLDRGALAEPGSSDRVNVCARWSELLMRHTDPALVALAFWLRPASVRRMLADVTAAQSSELRRSPRGLAYHVAPANVPTVAAYSFALSFLAGNASIVRVSTRSVATFRPIADALCAALVGASDDTKRSLAFITFGHEEEVTAALMSVADLRVLWGGNEAIGRLRRFPSKPRSRDVTFADRHSLAVFDATAIAEADVPERERMGEALFNDTYWFNQMACSSPSTLVWVGDETTVSRARPILHQALLQTAERRGYVLKPAAVLNKMVSAYSAIAEGVAQSVAMPSDALTVIYGGELEVERDDRPGFGFFRELRVDTLTQIGPLLDQRDQTIVHYGLNESGVETLAAALTLNGGDRVVPVGTALEFGRYWDGYDLLQEFTRGVHVRIS